MSSVLTRYLAKFPVGEHKSEVIAYLASLEYINSVSPSIGKSILKELNDQRSRLKLVASENYSSLAVQLVMGNLLTDKYCEGVPFSRFYGGCENVDDIEWEAIEIAKEVFNVDHANVQPHSGSDANLLALMTILTAKVQNPFVEKLSNKTINTILPEDYQKLRDLIGDQCCMGMSMNSGGHLTHGSTRLNVTSKLVRSVSYDVDPETYRLDYDNIAKIAKQSKPLLIIAGYSSYSRLINFATMRQIADDVGAVLMADMAHFSGLVAGGVITGEENPVGYADIITTTTHKTLRGPRGGLVLCSKEYTDILNKGCPLMMGGPLPHVIAAKSIALREAGTLSFKKYAKKIVENSRALCTGLQRHGLKILTDGTDNHMSIVDLRPLNINGKVAQDALQSVGIIVNRNAIPFDSASVWLTSGIRIGTPALTTLGMGETEMHEIAEMISITLNAVKDNISCNNKTGIVPSNILNSIKERVVDLLGRFPLYPEIDLTCLANPQPVF